jgi:hypothetical protein
MAKIVENIEFVASVRDATGVGLASATKRMGAARAGGGIFGGPDRNAQMVGNALRLGGWMTAIVALNHAIDRVTGAFDNFSKVLRETGSKGFAQETFVRDMFSATVVGDIGYAIGDAITWAIDGWAETHSAWKKGYSVVGGTREAMVKSQRELDDRRFAVANPGVSSAEMKVRGELRAITDKQMEIARMVANKEINQGFGTLATLNLDLVKQSTIRSFQMDLQRERDKIMADRNRQEYADGLASSRALRTGGSGVSGQTAYAGFGVQTPGEIQKVWKRVEENSSEQVDQLKRIETILQQISTRTFSELRLP